MGEYRVKYRYRGSSSYMVVTARDARTAAGMVEDMIDGCTVIQTTRL